VWVTPHYQTYLAQTLMAKRIDGEIPANSPLYMLGPRHNQMVYYLEVPIVPVAQPATLVRLLSRRDSAGKVFVLGPQLAAPILAKLGAVKMLDRSASIRRGQTESDRLTLMELTMLPQEPRSAPSGADHSAPR
jgi:hypothetical protein